MRFLFFKTEKLPRAARKELRPSKEFLSRGRERFLAAFDASAVAAAARAGKAGAGVDARPAYVTIFFKIGVGAAAAFCVFAGMSAYADTANVSATNPLYPLKRVSESVRLALAPASDKAAVQASLAVRRADEISSLEASHPTSTIIPGLMRDLDSDITGSLAEATGTTENEEVHVAAGVEVGIGTGTFRNGHAPAAAPRPGFGYAPFHYHAATDTTETGTAVAPVSVASGTAISAPVPTPTSSDRFGDDNEGKAFGVYCQALGANATGVLLGHLEGDLSGRPDVFTRFAARCGIGAGGVMTTSTTDAGGGLYQHLHGSLDL